MSVSRTYGVNKMLVRTYVIFVILSLLIGTGGSDLTCQKLRIMMDKKSHGVLPKESHSGKCALSSLFRFDCGLSDLA